MNPNNETYRRKYKKALFIFAVHQLPKKPLMGLELLLQSARSFTKG